jgi:hypothetical protein
MGASRAAESGSAKSRLQPERQVMPALVCDLCSWPMQIPDHCREQGAILGLLVCSQCVEDEVCARASVAGGCA